jgi:ADP-heptose:LPS heptosyltransferase
MARRTNNFERFLDRYVGIPAVAAIGVRRKRPRPAASSVQRIGVLKTGSVGDTLLLAGGFDALRAAYPAARIILITSAENSGAARLFGPVIDEHIEISVRSPLRSIRILRALSLDILVECGPWPRVDALLAAGSGARYTIGFRVRGQARHFALDHAVDHSSTAHQLENFRRLFAAAGARDFPPPQLTRPDALPANRLPPRPFVVFHPWSGGYMGWVKQWPDERWVALASRVSAARDVKVLASGGPRDVQRSAALTAALTARGVPAIDIAGQFTLAEMADVLGASELVVSVNTGIMHLAALLGVPTVSLEGPVPSRRWGPVGPRVRSVESTLPGCGYLDLGFEYKGQRLDCMEGVAVDAVLAAIDELLCTPS